MQVKSVQSHLVSCHDQVSDVMKHVLSRRSTVPHCAEVSNVGKPNFTDLFFICGWVWMHSQLARGLSSQESSKKWQNEKSLSVICPPQFVCLCAPSTFGHRETVLFHCECLISRHPWPCRITVLKLELLWQRVIRGVIFSVFMSILRIWWGKDDFVIGHKLLVAFCAHQHCWNIL